MSNGYIDALYNTLIGLCEIRGQLDPVSNQITEEQIVNVKELIMKAEAKVSIDGIS